MGNLSRYFKRKINDYVFGLTSFTPPSNYYAGLLTAYNVNDDSYTEVTSGSYNGYARVQIPNNKTSFTDAENSNDATITNAQEFRFPVKEGGSDVTVTHVGYFDSITGGNLIAVAEWSKTIQTGDRPVIEIGKLSIKMVNS